LSAYAIIGESDIALAEVMLGKAQCSAYTMSVAELDASGVTLVLAFGDRAARLLVPGFRSMVMDRGKPVLGASGKWAVMALFGAGGHLAETLADLDKAEALMFDGVVELMQPAPPRGWPDAIAFLRFEGERKTGKCMLCAKGSKVGAYSGEGLAWKLCEQHAWQSADWAATHLDAMREHADIATADAVAAKFERTAIRMQAELLGRKA
jgi:hypothetical protein